MGGAGEYLVFDLLSLLQLPSGTHSDPKSGFQHPGSSDTRASMCSAPVPNLLDIRWKVFVSVHFFSPFPLAWALERESLSLSLTYFHPRNRDSLIPVDSSSSSSPKSLAVCAASDNAHLKWKKKYLPVSEPLPEESAEWPQQRPEFVLGGLHLLKARTYVDGFVGPSPTTNGTCE